MQTETLAAALGRHPHIPLLHGATPLHPLPRLGAHLGGLRLFIKREDLTPVAFGGNKIRKLEYLAAAARAAGCDRLVTIGGIQSNHCRQTAAVAAMQGMGCDVLLVGAQGYAADAPARSGNFLLDGLLGARIFEYPDGINRPAALEAHLATLHAEGARPYAIPAGGSTATGSLGHVGTAIEIARQLGDALPGLKLVLHGSGSGGTQAGLLAGLAGLGLAVPLVGVSVGKSASDLAAIVDGLTAELWPLLDLEATSRPPAQVDDSCIGAGYAIPGPGTIAAIRLAAELEGILLDPVYSGKAMEGLIARAHRGEIGAGDTVVFVHTGGAPALFAYPERFSQ